jgi:hypothetical protein
MQIAQGRQAGGRLRGSASRTSCPADYQGESRRREPQLEVNPYCLLEWYSRIADIFVSYSKKHAQLTQDLARDLEAENYTTWWDTNLLPDDVFFPQTIRNEIAAAKAVIVIWAEHSVSSRWVYSEATEGDEQGKLLQVRDEALDARLVPMPFKVGNISPVANRAKIFDALARLGVKPSSHSQLYSQPLSGPSPAERDWEHFKITTTEDVSIIAAFILQHEESEPLWTGRARQRIAAVTEQAEEERRAKEETELKERTNRYKAEGQIEINAPFITNPHGRWFLPGAGKTEWFRDLDAGPEMVVVPEGPVASLQQALPNLRKRARHDLP